MSATPIPEGWLCGVHLARSVHVPFHFVRRCMVEGLVPSVARGRTAYADPQAVAQLYIGGTSFCPASHKNYPARLRAARATGLTEPTKPWGATAALGAPKCVLDMTQFRPRDRAFVLSTLRLNTCPTQPAAALEYVHVFLAVRDFLRSDGSKGIHVSGSADDLACDL